MLRWGWAAGSAGVIGGDFRAPVQGGLGDDAEREDVVRDPDQVHAHSERWRLPGRQSAHADDGREQQEADRGQLRADQVPGGAALLPGLRRHDEPEAAPEEYVADRRRTRADPQREQGEAVLLTTPGLDAVADHEEQQLVGDQERDEVGEEVAAEALDRL